jgi:hypothetical protein
MNMQIRTSIIAIALATAVATGFAQTVSVLATGLNSPIKIILTAEGNLLVSESTVQLNTGRVSIVDRGGSRRSLLEGLPSGPAYPGGAALGPAGLVLDGRTLYVSILEGNSLVAAVPGGPPLPNPNGPASPIFSSILKVRFSADVDRIQSLFNLSLDEQFVLADGLEVRLSNADGQTATVELLADFPDIPLDLREIHGHVTPFSIALDAAREFLYAADSGQNRVLKVNVNSGRTQTLVRFPRIPRVPALPGVTEIDAVPTGIRFYGDQLLVTFLTGAPFAEGEAVVRTVNPVTGEVRPFINGLTTATDVLHRSTAAADQFFVTEFRSILRPGEPGRLIQFDSPQGRVIADQLMGPNGIAQDPATGDIFVTEFLAGRITQVRLQ